jgi:putative hydrolase of the HAD superfamily
MVNTSTNPDKRLWIFDYDDTLAPNLHDYSESILRFIQYCIAEFKHKAPDIPTIVSTEDKIDRENVLKIDPQTGKPYNFTARRFPTSMVQTFEYLAEGVYIDEKPFVVTDKHREEVWKIAELAFDESRYKNQGLLPGVKKTLDFLVTTGDDMKLVSKGEEWVQQRKFAATDMKRWFGNNIYVVPAKNKEVLIQHSEGYDLRKVWHVGNSIKSDVIPAIEADIGMVLVPLETWSHEKKHDGKPTYSRLVELPTLEAFQFFYKLLPKL